MTPYTDRYGRPLWPGDRCAYPRAHGTMIDVTLIELIPLVPHRQPLHSHDYMREDQANRQGATHFRGNPSEPDKLFIAKYEYESKSWTGQINTVRKSTPFVKALVKVPAPGSDDFDA